MLLHPPEQLNLNKFFDLIIPFMRPLKIQNRPKFNILGHLSEENFEVELEQCILKYKWDVMGEEKD